MASGGLRRRANKGSAGGADGSHVALRPTLSPQAKRRFFKVNLPTLVIYTGLSIAGLYLLIKSRTIPALGFILAANVVLLAFHRWASKQEW
jgi:hypothetical protein